MLNNKGFTLVELLAVIVILITIMMIAIPSITSTISRSKDKDLNARKNFIISEVSLYVDSHKNSTKTFRNGQCSYSVDSEGKGNLSKIIDSSYLLDSDDDYITGCVIYKDGKVVFEDTCSINLLCN